MQFISQLIFASAALAASSFVTTTETETISSCSDSVTDCPYKNATTSTVSTFTAAANGAHGSYYAAGAAALAAGALLM